MADQSFEERNEAPSPKRRQDAREKGTVAKSVEINSVAVLIAALLGLKISGTWMMEQMGRMMRSALRQIAAPSMDEASCLALMYAALYDFLKLCAPVVVCIVIFGIVSNVVQVGFLMTGQPLMPKLERINPLSGLKRMFSMRSVVETIKSILKMAIIAVVVYVTIHQKYEEMLLLGDTAVNALWMYIVQISYSVLFRSTIILLILAILDYGYQRWEYERNLRMTRQELKEERKQLEGDPLLKSRIRSLQREIARRRMMQEVPKATVVVTNPTHIAVALQYDPPAMEAPVVIAKGKELVAEKIKSIAKQHDIPVVEDKPLARALFNTVEIGGKIPVEFFNAVAEILAYVYKLKRKTAA